MSLTHLYELTTAEFDLHDFLPRQESPGHWTVGSSPSSTVPRTSQEAIVGHGATEEAALRDLRLQWVAAKYGEYRG